MGIKHIVEPVFRMNIFYIDSPDVKGYKKEFKKLNGVDTDAGEELGGRFEGIWNDEQAIERAILWVPSGQLDVLIHEINHCVFWILNTRRDTPHTDATDEAYSYLSQFILKECLSKKFDSRIKIRRDLENYVVSDQSKVAAKPKREAKRKTKKGKVHLLRRTDRKNGAHKRGGVSRPLQGRKVSGRVQKS